MEQLRSEEEYGYDKAHMKIHMDFLTKHLLLENMEKVNAVGSYSSSAKFDTKKEANYLNYKGFSSRWPKKPRSTINARDIITKLVIETMIKETRRIKMTKADCMCHLGDTII